MLHQDSAYNLVENNIALGNTDNFVIYGSNHNTIRGNTGYAPRSSNVRINEPSYNNYITGNKLYGGSRGIYLYDKVANTYIKGNTIQGAERNLQTTGAHNTIFAGNFVANIHYDIADGDRMIFGENTVKSENWETPTADQLLKEFR
jgi:parallel beta-helix repeat protein